MTQESTTSTDATTEDSGQEEFTGLFADEAEELQELYRQFEEKDDDSQETSQDDGTDGSANTNKPTGDPDPKEAEGDTENNGDKDAKEVESSSETDSKEEGEKTDTSDSSDSKPPKNYVPHGALHEERKKRQEVQVENDSLTLQVAELQKRLSDQGEKSSTEEFKVLSDDDLEDLKEEDPESWMQYKMDLMDHKQQQRDKDQDSLLLAQAQKKTDAVMTKAWEGIQELVPDIAEGGEKANTLANFATAHGFHQGYLAMMTNPGAKITVGDKTFPLGEGALSLVRLLNTVSTNEKSQKETLETELRESITKEVTDEIMKKMKTTNQEFKSIGDSPSGGSIDHINIESLTEEEYEKLPEAQRQALLGG